MVKVCEDRCSIRQEQYDNGWINPCHQLPEDNGLKLLCVRLSPMGPISYRLGNYAEKLQEWISGAMIFCKSEIVAWKDIKPPFEI